MKKPTLFATLYKSPRGWRWRMQTRNGRVIGASTEAYLERRKAAANFAKVTGLESGRSRQTRFYAGESRVRV